MPFRPPLAVVVLLGVVSFAAPVPKPPKAGPHYFPTTVGAKWAYETANGELESAAVSAAETDGADLVVSREGWTARAPHTQRWWCRPPARDRSGSSPVANSAGC